MASPGRRLATVWSARSTTGVIFFGSRSVCSGRAKSRKRLTRHPRRKLPERCQSLRSPSLRLRLLEAAVCLGQSFRQCLIALGLTPVLDNTAVYHHRSEKEKKN